MRSDSDIERDVENELRRESDINATDIASRYETHHFRPLHDRVLLKRVEVEEKTPAGVSVPHTAKEKPVEGRVPGIGPAGISGARHGYVNLRYVD
jgi:hypothetical protein